MAVGTKFDAGSDLLFVAGGTGGNAYVYNTVTLEPVAEITLAPGFINDVALTPQGAWFTNSKVPELYFVPFDGLDDPEAVETLTFYGQGLELTDPMNFGFNGIAAAKGGRVPWPGASNEPDATVSEVVLVPARL